MIHKKILKIRQELVERISECARQGVDLISDFGMDETTLIKKISNLPDDEMLDLYIEHTFDSEWRVELIEQL